VRTVPRSLKVFAAPLLALALTVSACSGDDEPDQPETPISAPEVKSIETTARVAKITGRLPKNQRQKTVAAVTGAVDGWWDAAYLTVDAKNPFPGFTAGAARLAKRDADIMTNARFADGADGLVATRRVVTVDVLAARQKAAGVTAKVLLVFETEGDKARRVTVRGTVELSRDNGRWRIFGYRMSATPKEIK
jgi:hypothetical protein